jgi:predicted ATPase
MRLRELKIKNFRNLKNFHVRFEDESITVLLGKNGAAKSNLIEAITSIFAELEIGASPSFNYWLAYVIGEDESTEIIVDAEFPAKAFQVSIGLKKPEKPEYETVEKLDYETFVKAEEDYEGDLEFKPETMRRKYANYLPSNVIVYYSGLSDRLQCYSKPVKEKYREELLNGEDPPLRRVFLTDGSHSSLILFAFLLNDNEWAKSFLADKLGIERLESVRLTISRPTQWPDRVNPDDWQEEYGLIPIGEDAKFFRLEGELLQTLKSLNSASIPLREMHSVAWSELNTKQEKSDLKAQEELHRLHLFFHYKHSDPRQLYKAGVTKKGRKKTEVPPAFVSPKQLFQRLEDLRLAGFGLEFSYKIKIKGTKDLISLRYLSEGEQQLLTVIGLLRFTRDNDTLFLLDEPDTHLNPQWSYEYKRMLEEAVRNDDGTQDRSSQIIMATHDPILIAGLRKENVQIMRRRAATNGNERPDEFEKVTEPDSLAERPLIEVNPPMEHPQGMSVSRILESELFGIPSFDEETLKKLKRKRDLAFETERQLSPDEVKELRQLIRDLRNVDMTQIIEDPLYSYFVKVVVNHPDYLRMKEHTWTDETFDRLKRITEEVKEEMWLEAIAKQEEEVV